MSFNKKIFSIAPLIILIAVGIIFLLSQQIQKINKEDIAQQPKNIGDECLSMEDSYNLAPGLQCYFYGEGEQRKAIVIKTDIQGGDFLLGFYNPEYYKEQSEISTDWNEVSDSKNRYMFKIPEGVFLDEQPDGGYSVALGNLVDTADMPTSFWIKTTDTNAIPMADLFPKGCLEREITLASKSFERFDCLPQTNVEGNGATTLFRQEEGFYYTINFNKTQNTLLDYYTEAILLSLTFDQDTE